MEEQIDYNEIFVAHEAFIDAMVLIDTLTDSGNFPSEREEFMSLVHDVYGSWEEYERARKECNK